MRSVFFVSHQWTSYNHPDHSLRQLRTFQRLLTRMICGQCPDTVPGFAHTAQFGDARCISSADWKRIVPNAFIWMDYFSVRRGGARARGTPRAEES